MSKRVSGLNKVLQNLNNEIRKIERRSLKGLIRSAILIRRDMEYTSPLVPVDLGNLRASFFVVSSGGSKRSSAKFKGEEKDKLLQNHNHVQNTALIAAKRFRSPMVVLGFTAYYAWFVHEKVGANFQRPGAGAKFFEAALKRNSSEIIKILKSTARIR